jgi:hypothetical protein
MARGRPTTAKKTKMAYGLMVRAEVTPVDHPCVAFRSSAEYPFGFSIALYFVLPLLRVLHQQLFAKLCMQVKNTRNRQKSMASILTQSNMKLALRGSCRISLVDSNTKTVKTKVICY